MAKQTKNILTYAECKKEIFDTIKKQFIFDLIFSIITLLLYIPTIVFSISLMPKIFILGLLLMLPFAVCTVAVILVLVLDIMELVAVNNDKLLICTDIVKGTEKGVFTHDILKILRVAAFALLLPFMMRYRRTYVKVIHFSQKNKYEIEDIKSPFSFGFEIFDMATYGEEFYIVYLPGKKRNKIYTVYHTSMYEYNGR